MPCQSSNLIHPCIMRKSKKCHHHHIIVLMLNIKKDPWPKLLPASQSKLFTSYGLLGPRAKQFLDVSITYSIKLNHFPKHFPIFSATNANRGRQCCVDENLTVKEKRIYESARKRKVLLSVVKQDQNKEEN